MTSASDQDITIDDIRAAQQLIGPFIVRTPLLEKGSLTRLSGFCSLLWKCENLQQTGSFKIRGATNAVLCAVKENPGKSITFVAASSGNHGQALAKAAVKAQQRAIIVCPRTAPKSKIAAMEANGAQVVLCEPNQKAREAGVAALMQQRGNGSASTELRLHVHPYSGEPRGLVHAGQGTCGIEILEQLRAQKGKGVKPDVIIVPVGGGGFISGVAIAIKALSPGTLVVGAEPAAADDAARSFKSGRVEQNFLAPPKTIADGAMTTLSEQTLKNIREHVDCIITVTEDEIALAMRNIFERMKLVIEPTAGVPAAVALFRRHQLQSLFPGRKLESAVSILCGGNVDVDSISQLISVSKL